jgi:hypothetical protein
MLATFSVMFAACGTTSAQGSSTSHHSIITGSVTGYGGPIRVIKGKVVDPTPWSIADMAVIVTRADSDVAYRVYTNGSGRFSLDLPRGDYAIAASCEPGRTQPINLGGGGSASVQLACDYP